MVLLRVGCGRIIAPFAVDQRVHVEATTERPLGVLDPLVEVADHVEGAAVVRAAVPLAGLTQRVLQLVDERVIHAFVPHPVGRKAQALGDLGHGMELAAVVVADALLSRGSIGVGGPSRTSAGGLPFGGRAEALARCLASALGLDAGDVGLRDRVWAADRADLDLGAVQGMER